VLLNNLVGSILTPNLNYPTLTYRIVKQEIFTDAYGDVDASGIIDADDIARAVVLDGYYKALTGGTIPSATQINAIANGTVSMAEIIRADVDNNGFINVTDAGLIQQHIILNSAFTAGSEFKRVVLTVENTLNPTTTTVDMVALDVNFNTVPYVALTYQIDFVSTWKPYYLTVTDLRRFVPKTFATIESTEITGTTKTGGKNTSFIPGDLLLGGNLLNENETPYSVDLELANVIIELPDGSTQGEIDIFNNFIKNIMTFSDGTYVGADALTDNQVRIVAAIQSIAKDIDGYGFDYNDGYSEIDQTVSVLYTQSSGLLRIRAANIHNVVLKPELRTKIILAVYLKKAGFANDDQTIPAATVTSLLTAI
jgi:hypothetical protein